jgi:allantoin racemase
LRLLVISPNTSAKFLEGQKRELIDLPHVEVAGITRGPESVECYYDDMLAAPHIVELAQKAEQDGFDAVVISCFFDPGLKAAREALSIPVTSAGEASLFLACSLGDKIGVVTTVKNSIPVIHHLVKGLGLENRVVNVRATSLGVLDLDKSENTVQALFNETMSIVKEDGADVVVLGCTGMTEPAMLLQQRVASSKYDIPIVDPLRAAICSAETLVKLKLRQSRLAYPKPPVKARTS